MNRKPAVLAYPNSNNLGDYIQSIAAKQLIGDDKIAELKSNELKAKTKLGDLDDEVENEIISSLEEIIKKVSKQEKLDYSM